MHVSPEGNAIFNGRRALDRPKAGDVFMAHRGADAAGFHDADLQARLGSGGTAQTL
jgi:hypothetical protein